MIELLQSTPIAFAAISATELWTRGGIIMVPLLLCSVVAIAAVLERLTRLRRSVVLSPQPSRVLDALTADDTEALRELSQPGSGPIGRLLDVALDHEDAPRELLTESVRDAGRREVQRLEEHLGLLAMIGAIAPLLGLLGTVLGMIRAFDALYLGGANGGGADPVLLAQGISEALFTTGVGLTVAIPALLAHHLLLGRVDRLTTDLEEAAIEIVRIVARRQPAAAPVSRIGTAPSVRATG